MHFRGRGPHGAWRSTGQAGKQEKYGRKDKKGRDRPIGRILYARRTWQAIIPLDAALLPRSSHLPACSNEPPFRPARGCACLFGVAPGRGCRVSPCGAALCKQSAQHGVGRAGACQACPRRRLVSVALFLSGRRPKPAAAGRPLAATLPYGVRTFLDIGKYRDCPACLAPILYRTMRRRRPPQIQGPANLRQWWLRLILFMLQPLF